MSESHATTVLCVRKHGVVSMICDGQVSAGSTIVKGNARKIRLIGGEKIPEDKKVLVGFAGAVTDALILIQMLEKSLNNHPSDMTRGVIEFCKEWRTNKMFNRLEATLLIANGTTILTVGGSCEVLENDSPVEAIGSGGHYAKAASLALMDIETITATEVCHKAMTIAAGMCVYTNTCFTSMSIPSSASEKAVPSPSLIHNNAVT